MKAKQIIYISIRSLVLIAILNVVHGCKQRDDWPHFDKVDLAPTPPQKESEDLNKSWYTEMLESKGNAMFKKFINDTVFQLHEGVTYTELRFIDGLDQPQRFHIIEADLNHPKVGVTSMAAFGLPWPNIQQISKMAVDNDGKDGKILAAINGGIHTTAVNNYALPSYGFVFYDKIIKAFNYSATNLTRPYFGIKKDGEIVFGNTPDNSKEPFTWIEQSEFRHQIYGNNFVVYNSWLNTANTDRICRSVVGFNEIENKIYFIAADAFQTGVAGGMGLPNVAILIRDLKINKAFLPNNSLFVQLAIRKEQVLSDILNVSFPLVNKPMPYSGTGDSTPGGLANGIAIVIK